MAGALDAALTSPSTRANYRPWTCAWFLLLGEQQLQGHCRTDQKLIR